MNDIPRRLRQRPRFKGMPIPYTTFIGNDGQPDFKVVDTTAVHACYKRRLCGLCGQSLSSQIVFIGGPVSVENRCFIDPAMHEDCALYAVGICPYLVNPSGDYSNAPIKHRNQENVNFSSYNMSPGRPEKMAFYYCNGYNIVVSITSVTPADDKTMAMAWASTKIDWDIIPSLSKGHSIF